MRRDAGVGHGQPLLARNAPKITHDGHQTKQQHAAATIVQIWTKSDGDAGQTDTKKSRGGSESEDAKTLISDKHV